MTTDAVFYVYEHWRPDTGVCFYVGKGRRRRAWDLKFNRNEWHLAIVSKLTSLGLAVDIRLIAKDLTEDAAFALERERISLYSSLTNLTDGGEGMSGFVHSAETKKYWSETRKGRRMSEEAKAKISAALKGRKKSPEHAAKVGAASAAGRVRNGYKPTAITLAKKRVSMLGRKDTAEVRARKSAAQQLRFARRRTA